MSLLNNWFLSAQFQLYALNVAGASILASGVGLIVVIWFRKGALPTRHGILLATMTATLVSPLLIAWAFLAGISVWWISLSEAKHPAPQPQAVAPGTEWVGKRTTFASVPANVPSVQPPVHDHRTGLDEANVASDTTAITLPVRPGVVTARRSRDVVRGVGNVLCAIWFVGSLASLAWIVRGALAVRGLTKSLIPVTSQRVLRISDWAMRRVDRQKLPAIEESSLVSTPLSFGLLRERIVLPSGLDAELDDDQLGSVLLHEMAHLVRRDHWVGLAQRVTVASFWWNPLVHRITSQLCELREQICDDIATAPLAMPDRYAKLLVDLLQRVVNDRHFRTAIGILPNDSQQFERRLKRLFDSNRSKAIRLSRLGALALLAFGCVVSLLIIGANVQMKAVRETSGLQVTPVAQATGAPPRRNTSSAADTPPDVPVPVPAAEAQPLRWPDRLRGLVTNDQNEPIRNAMVELELMTQDNYSTGHSETIIRRDAVTTDAAGKYEFDPVDFPRTTHRPFVYTVRASAPGYASWKNWNWFGPGTSEVGSEFPTLELPGGRTLRGRCLDPAGKPVSGAVIRPQFIMNDKGAWGVESAMTTDNGSFELVAPQGTIPELWIIGDGLAPCHVARIAATDDLGDITLESGTALTGILQSRDSKPVGNCVVVLESADGGDVQGVHFPVTFASQTDAQGRFRFPPVRGDYKLYVAQASRTDESLSDRFVVSPNPPPFVEPQIISLDGQAKEKSVQINGLPTVVVSGAIRWPGGQPAVGCDVTAWFMGAEGFQTGVKLASGLTDQEGRYSFQLPQTQHEVDVTAIGLNDTKRVFYIARPAESAPAAQKSLQHMTFHALEKDLAGADWLLERFESPESTAPEREAKQAQVPAEAELERLSAQYSRLQEKYFQALSKATTDAELDTVYRTLDPRNLLADEFLQLEQRHRGTLAGFSALHRLESLARSVGSPEIPVSLARQKLVDILIKHYLDHEDLDLCLSGFDAGATVEKSAVLLKRASESRHRHVRAAALYFQAMHSQELAEGVEQMDRALIRLAKDPQKNAAVIDSIKTHRAGIGPIDVEASRRTAIKLAEQVKNEYGDAREPSRIVNSRNWLIRHVPTSELVDQDPSYGELATGLLFKITRLTVGQPVPDFTGTDLSGKPFRLSDLRGKVVGVLFTSSPASEELTECQKISDEFPVGALALVGINSYPKKEDVANAVRQSKIKWPMLWEGNRGPIATQWHIQGWPTTYVIDAKGIIRAKTHGLQSAKELVEELIREATQR